MWFPVSVPRSVFVLCCPPCPQREDRSKQGFAGQEGRAFHFTGNLIVNLGTPMLQYALPIRTPLKAFIRIVPGHMIFTSTANQTMRCTCHRCFRGGRHEPCNHGPLAAAVALSCIYREDAPPNHVELTVVGYTGPT